MPKSSTLSPRLLFTGIALFILSATFTSTLRADAGNEIDFAHDVAPILQKRCAKCHTGTQKKGGLSLNTRQSLLTGGDSGPAVLIRKSAQSELIERVSSTDADLKMPPEGESLPREQIDTLRRWIDLDLPWEDGFAFGKMTRQAPLQPRATFNVPDDPGSCRRAVRIRSTVFCTVISRSTTCRRPVSFPTGSSPAGPRSILSDLPPPPST